MEFGLIKSKIEKCLSNSYLNETFKKELFIFNELVLKNKEVNKLFSLYSDLAENRGYDSYFAGEFIKESIDRIKKIKPNKKALLEINMWISDIESNNEYKDIDNLVSNKNISVEDKIKSKHTILENLKLNNKTKQEVKKLPISEMVGIANDTVKKYLNSIDESKKIEIEKLLKEDDSKLELKYEIIKETVVEKLNNLRPSSESDVITRIDETLNKLESEKYNKINYFKLKELNNTL